MAVNKFLSIAKMASTVLRKGNVHRRIVWDNPTECCGVEYPAIDWRRTHGG